MTYRIGEVVTLSTAMAGSGTAPTMTLTVTKPDGTSVAPTVSAAAPSGTGWTWTASFAVDQAGDWLWVFIGSGSYSAVDDGQFHVVGSALRIVGLAEVKEHGNITSAGSDRELLDFIGTAEQMIEAHIGPVVPRTVSAERLTIRPGATMAWLAYAPVLEVITVVENGITLEPADYLVWLDTGQADRLSGGTWCGREALFTYRAGRNPIPAAIRWAAKELTVHLWRSTQAQRGGRARGEQAESAAGYALPNRVREALIPFALSPLVA